MVKGCDDFCDKSDCYVYIVLISIHNYIDNCDNSLILFGKSQTMELPFVETMWGCMSQILKFEVSPYSSKTETIDATFTRLHSSPSHNTF